MEAFMTNPDEFLYPKEIAYPFLNKLTGEKQIVMAIDPQLATLRAWKINPNLTFDIEEVKKND